LRLELKDGGNDKCEDKPERSHHSNDRI
jgi:hypothetical protein